MAVDGRAESPHPTVDGRRHRLEERGEEQSLGACRIAPPGRAEGRLGLPVHLHCPRPLAVGTQASRRREHQPGVLTQDALGHRVEPAPTARQAVSSGTKHAADGVPRGRPAVGRKRVRDGTLALEQGASPDRQLPRSLLATLVDEHALEVASQDFVVPVRAHVVDPDREDLASLEFLQESRAAARSTQLVAERCRQAAQDAGVHEEPAQFRRKDVEDVAGQVLAHERGAPAQALQEVAPLARRLVPGREVEQLEPGSPPLRAAREARQLVGAERLAVEVAEEAFDLPGTEPEVVARDLQQLARQAPPRGVERGQAACPGHEVNRRWQVLHQPSQLVFGRGAGDRVQVVEHQEEAPSVQAFEARGGHLRIGPRLPEGVHGESIRCPRVGDRGAQVGQEYLGASVRALDAVPRRGVSHRDRRRGPLREQCGLARSGRRDDEGRGMAPDLREPPIETLARQPADPGASHPCTHGLRPVRIAHPVVAAWIFHGAAVPPHGASRPAWKDDIVAPGGAGVQPPTGVVSGSARSYVVQPCASWQDRSRRRRLPEGPMAGGT